MIHLNLLWKSQKKNTKTIKLRNGQGFGSLKGDGLREVPAEKSYNRDPNSMELDPEQVYAYLTLVIRTPHNDYERELLKEINRIKRDGFMVDIPSNGI